MKVSMSDVSFFLPPSTVHLRMLRKLPASSLVDLCQVIMTNATSVANFNYSPLLMIQSSQGILALFFRTSQQETPFLLDSQESQFFLSFGESFRK